jgi:hypothetical protein
MVPRKVFRTDYALREFLEKYFDQGVVEEQIPYPPSTNKKLNYNICPPHGAYNRRKDFWVR